MISPHAGQDKFSTARPFKGATTHLPSMAQSGPLTAAHPIAAFPKAAYRSSSQAMKSYQPSKVVGSSVIASSVVQTTPRPPLVVSSNGLVRTQGCKQQLPIQANRQVIVVSSKDAVSSQAFHVVSRQAAHAVPSQTSVVPPKAPSVVSTPAIPVVSTRAPSVVSTPAIPVVSTRASTEVKSIVQPNDGFTLVTNQRHRQVMTAKQAQPLQTKEAVVPVIVLNSKGVVQSDDGFTQVTYRKQTPKDAVSIRSQTANAHVAAPIVKKHTALCGTTLLRKIRGEHNLECPFKGKCSFAHTRKELQTYEIPKGLNIDTLGKLVHCILANNPEAVQTAKPGYHLPQFEFAKIGELINEYSFILAKIQALINAEMKPQRKERCKKSDAVAQKDAIVKSEACLRYMAMQKSLQFKNQLYTTTLALELSRRTRSCPKYSGFIEKLLIKKSDITEKDLCCYSNSCGHGVHADIFTDDYKLVDNIDPTMFGRICLQEFSGHCDCNSKRSGYNWGQNIKLLRQHILNLNEAKTTEEKQSCQLNQEKVSEAKRKVREYLHVVFTTDPMIHLIEDGIFATDHKQLVSASADAFSNTVNIPKFTITKASYFTAVSEQDLDQMIADKINECDDSDSDTITTYYKSRAYQLIKFDSYITKIGSDTTIAIADLFNIWLGLKVVPNFNTWLNIVQSKLLGVNLNSLFIIKWIRSEAYQHMSLADFEADEQNYRTYYIWVKTGSRVSYSEFLISLEPHLKRWNQRFFPKSVQPSAAPIVDTEEIGDSATLLKGKKAKSKKSRGCNKYRLNDVEDDEEVITSLARYYPTFEAFYFRLPLKHSFDGSNPLFREYCLYYENTIRSYQPPMSAAEYEQSVAEQKESNTYIEYVQSHFRMSSPLALNEWILKDEIRIKVASFSDKHPKEPFHLVLRYFKLNIEELGITWDTFRNAPKAVCKWIDVQAEFPKVTFEEYSANTEIYDKLFRTGLIYKYLRFTDGNYTEAVENFKKEAEQGFEVVVTKMNSRNARITFQNRKKEYEAFLEQKKIDAVAAAVAAATIPNLVFLSISVSTLLDGSVSANVSISTSDPAKPTAPLASAEPTAPLASAEPTAPLAPAEPAAPNRNRELRKAKREKLQAQQVEKEGHKSEQIPQRKIDKWGRTVPIGIDLTIGYDSTSHTENTVETIVFGKKSREVTKSKTIKKYAYYVEAEFTNIVKTRKADQTKVTAFEGDGTKIAANIYSEIGKHSTASGNGTNYPIKRVDGSTRLGFRAHIEDPTQVGDFVSVAFPAYLVELAKDVDAFKSFCKNGGFKEGFRFEFPQTISKNRATYIDGSNLSVYSTATFPANWEPSKLQTLSDGILPTCERLITGGNTPTTTTPTTNTPTTTKSTTTKAKLSRVMSAFIESESESDDEEN